MFMENGFYRQRIRTKIQSLLYIFKMTKTIGIIGGKGLMGKFFAEFFKHKGFTVLISDKNTKLTNR